MPLLERRSFETKEGVISKKFYFVRIGNNGNVRRKKSKIILIPAQNNQFDLTDEDMNLFIQGETDICMDAGYIEKERNRFKVYGDPFSILSKSFFKQNINKHQERRETGDKIAELVSNKKLYVLSISD